MSGAGGLYLTTIARIGVDLASASLGAAASDYAFPNPSRITNKYLKIVSTIGRVAASVFFASELSGLVTGLLGVGGTQDLVGNSLLVVFSVLLSPRCMHGVREMQSGLMGILRLDAPPIVTTVPGARTRSGQDEVMVSQTTATPSVQM